jgi:hypothetical protein
MGDRMIEDRRVGRQTGDREIVDVAFECAAIEKLSRYVVEPDALPKIVERLSSFHFISGALFAFQPSSIIDA